MADDGMLLNFSVGDGPPAVKPVFRGGRWKDRLTARKSAQYGKRKKQEVVEPQAVNGEDSSTREATRADEDISARPTKRQRVDEGFRPANTSRSKAAIHSNGVHTHQKPQQVVSSLFTYNPSATTKKEEQAPAEAPIEPSNAPLAGELETFTSLGLSSTLASHLMMKLDIKAPTAIQKAAIAQLLKEDSDAFIQAETGSGKTLAYLLPIIQRIMTISAATKELAQHDGGEVVHRDSGLFAIILAPTRELSKQISVVLEGLLRRANWIVPGLVIGGEKKKSEKARLRKGLNILVATPGRLADHLQNTKALDVSNVRWLILDEGDRLMELGFENDIQKILSLLDARQSKTPKILGLPSRRTTVLCSATMKMNVQRLGEISLKDAVHIQAESSESSAGEKPTFTEDQKFSAPAQLKQSFAVVPAKLRLVTLTAVLKRAFARKGSVNKAIVFISCADSVNFHFDIFSRSPSSSSGADISPQPASNSGLTRPDNETTTADPNYTSASSPALSANPQNPVTIYRLHGSLPQHIRTSTLSTYTHSKTPAILFCTDVASRGLDLPNVDLVIEYDPPFSADEHLHRIGRTARAGRDGRAMIFLMPGVEEGYVEILKKGRREGIGGSGITRHDAEELLKKGFSPSSATKDSTITRSQVHNWEDQATTWQLDLERWILAHHTRLEQARRAFQSHVRAYATHVAAERSIFDIKELHLGHLAKAFGLRDRPGAINVPGLRQSRQDVVRAAKVPRARKGDGLLKEDGKQDAEVLVRGQGTVRPKHTEVAKSEFKTHPTDEQAARRKMQKLAQMQGAGASEFNLG